MNKKSITFILICFIIFLSLFSKNCYCAYPSYSTTDDGTDGPDVTSTDIDWTLTYYGGATLDAGFTDDDFTINDTYGWREYTIDGEKYVVLAAATHEYLGSSNLYEFGSYKFDYIHYFNYNDKIQFKFEDESFDSNVYNAIILGSCGVSLYPPYWAYNDNVQILDVYMGSDGQGDTKGKNFNNKKVLITDTGVFSSKAASKSSFSLSTLIINLCTLIGDSIQIVINCAETWSANFKITYSRSEIESDASLNSEIQVEDADYEGKTNTIKTINILAKLDNESGTKETAFSTDTEIPVIPADVYSSSINKTDLFDLDFYSTSNENTNKFWKFIKNLVTIASHAVLYISAALLLTMIIWRGVLLVGATMMSNPEKVAKSKKIMDGFFKAIILIAGIYVIMVGMTYFYQEMLDVIMNGSDSKYLIRVNVEELYSFNTNIIGYIRYRTLTANTYGALGYAIIYALVNVFVSLPWFVFMFGRMVVIGLLTIVAPLTAVTYMRGNDGKSKMTNFLSFGNWFKVYMRLLWAPMALIIIIRVLLRIV